MTPGVDFELETFQLEFLTRTGKYAELDPELVDRLAQEHVGYRMRLRAEGRILAAGAVRGAEESRNVRTGEPVVGLGFWNRPREEVLRLIAEDPGVRAGLYEAELVQYICPKGAITFEEPHR